jgi:quercetin dioxygenase-like cupin family protein
VKVNRISPEAAAPGSSGYFVGEAAIQTLVACDEGLDIAVVRFRPGARTYLHSHSVPQVLVCVEGRGFLATESDQNEVGPGDVVYVPAGEMHWHGAAGDSEFVHVSIRPPGDRGEWTKVDPRAGG